MSEFFTHKGLTYELKENQGFYICLVYEKGSKRILYQTRYLGSAERARSSAMVFIQDYIAYEENKQRRAIEGAQKKREKREKKDKKKKAGVRPSIAGSRDQKRRNQTPKPQGQVPAVTPAAHQVEAEQTPSAYTTEAGLTQALYTIEAGSSPARYPAVSVTTPVSVPNAEQSAARVSKPDAPAKGIRERIINNVITFSALILIGTGIVYGFSELVGNGGGEGQGPPPGASNMTIEPVIELPDSRGNALPTQEFTSTTPSLAVTSTTTPTITPTKTEPSTQPTSRPTNTSSPTPQPSATSTPTPSPTATVTSSAAPSPSPTSTLTTTATPNPPTDTPVPPTDTPIPPTPTETPPTP
jgi:hypothetical protein